MLHLRLSILLIFLIFLFYAASSELRCFEGEEICQKWKNVDEAEYGTFNGVVRCCPPEPNQAILLLSGNNCQCRAGTAEKYANYGSGSPAIRPLNLLSVVIMLISVFLF